MDRIDSQSSGAIAARLRMRAIEPVASARAPTAIDTDGEDTTRLTGLDLAGSEAPVDTARVGAIRTAIESGQYLIEPNRIADAMISAGFMLRTEG